MAIRPPQPNYDGAARNSGGQLNVHLENALRTLHARLEVLERGSGTQGLDPDRQQKLSVRPPRAGLTVMTSQGGGQVAVSINNPEFGQEKGKNPLRTALIHRVEYSTDPAFRTGVTRLPQGPQTYFPVKTAPGTTLHFRLTSSFDGRTFNAPVLSGPVKA